VLVHGFPSLMRLMAAWSSTGCRRRGLSLTTWCYSPKARASTGALVGDPALATEASSSCLLAPARCIPGGGILLLSGASPTRWFSSYFHPCLPARRLGVVRWTAALPLRARWRHPSRASLARWRVELLHLASTPANRREHAADARRRRTPLRQQRDTSSISPATRRARPRSTTARATSPLLGVPVAREREPEGIVKCGHELFHGVKIRQSGAGGAAGSRWKKGINFYRTRCTLHATWRVARRSACAALMCIISLHSILADSPRSSSQLLRRILHVCTRTL
jgi:hypothetical protein